MAHRRHVLARMGGDDRLDRRDHAAAELVGIHAGSAVHVAGEHVLPAREAFLLELFDRDVVGCLSVVLGDPVRDGDFDPLLGRNRLRSLERATERAGVDGVDALDGQVLGKAASLVMPVLCELGVRGTSEALDPKRERMPDQKQLHRVSC